MIEIEGFDEMYAMVNVIKVDIEMLDDILQDPQFIDDLQVILAENWTDIFDSEGGAISEDWGTSLVDTGRLRASLTVPGQIDIQVYDDNIVFGTSVPYAGYVNDKYIFAEIQPSSTDEIGNLISSYLRRRGSFNWS